MTAVEWLAKHRGAAVVTAGLVVVAVVATLLVVAVTARDPEDVVQEYLDAIRAGDTETALAIAGRPEPTGTLSFLTADALADDWSVDRIVPRQRAGVAEADVDVRLRAGERTEEGRFHLVEGEDGWTIENPLVEVALPVGEFDTVELGSRRVPVGDARSEGPGSVKVTVFPGVYHPYPSLRTRLTTTPAALVVAPRQKDATLQVDLAFAVTKEGAANANGVLSRHITDCATRTGAEPAGCPFSAEETLYGFHEVQSVTWSVVTLPEVVFVPPRDPRQTVATVLRKPGVVTMTATGIEEEGGAPTTVTADCEFGVETLRIRATMDRFTVTEADTAYLNTRCY